MLSLTYVEDAPAPDGASRDVLESADNSVLQAFPRDQTRYAPPEAALTQAIVEWVAKRGYRPEPIVLMVHGYMFNPALAPTSPDSPFGSIYGLPPGVNWHLSWLPLVGECDETGANLAENAIGFCYQSIASLGVVGELGWENSYQHAVFELAPRAARALASIIGALVAHAPLVRILAHSLGTRTTSQAIRLVRARLTSALDRIVMLDGAEFCVDAAASFAGCDYDVFNIVNRTDSVLRIGAEQFCHPFRATGTIGACVLGYDGLGGNDRWMDLQIDSANLLSWLAAGNAPDGVRYAVNPVAQDDSHSFAGLDHWACYTNDGNRPLVRDLLRSDVMTIANMKRFRVPDGANSPAYGIFNNQPIPPTPLTRMDRQRALAQGNLGSGGGDGGGG